MLGIYYMEKKTVKSVNSICLGYHMVYCMYMDICIQKRRLCAHFIDNAHWQTHMKTYKFYWALN